MHGHRHDPNPHPPSPDPSFRAITPDGRTHPMDLAALQALPAVTVDGCYIVSTGHGTSGPFTFQGARLLDLIRRCWGHRPWSQVQVISGDGFGTTLGHAEVDREERPALLAYRVDGRPMTRAEGAGAADRARRPGRRPAPGQMGGRDPDPRPGASVNSGTWLPSRTGPGMV